MESQKIINTDQISWYEDDSSRLDYKEVFQDKKIEREHGKTVADKETEKAYIKALLRENDKKWKKRLKKARQVAFAKGREKGIETGYERAEEEIDEKLGRLEMLLEQGHQKWLSRHESLNPGLLDLVFEMVEEIVGLPVENPEIRSTLEEELVPLLHEAESNFKPILRISEYDYRFIEELVEKYAPETAINIRIHEDFNTGEFEFETDKKTVVYSFKEMLNDFREKISLPSWK